MLIALTTTCLCMDKKYLQNSWKIKHDQLKSIVMNPDKKFIFLITAYDDKLCCVKAYTTQSGALSILINNINQSYTPKIKTNLHDPSWFIYKDDKNHILYNIKENTYKHLNTSYICEHLGKTIDFGTTHTIKSYNIYNDQTTITDFGNPILYTYLAHNNNHIIIATQKGMYNYDIEKETYYIIAERTIVPERYVTNSTNLFAYFDETTSSINLYNLKNHTTSKKKIKKSLQTLDFITDTTIIFTNDNKQFTVWNIKNDTFDDLNMPSAGSWRNIIPEMIEFVGYDNDDASSKSYIYDLYKKKLFILNNEYIARESSDNYVLGYDLEGEKKITIYAKNNWEQVSTIDIPSDCGYLKFSPCGEYFAIQIGDKSLIFL